MNVRYEARQLPDGVPAAVVAGHGEVVVLVDESLTAHELCAVLTPLINEHAKALWLPSQAIA